MMRLIMRNVSGSPGYQIGADGSLWRLYSKGSRRKVDFRRIPGTVNKDGYIRHAVPRGDGSYRPVFAHVLVLEAFVGPRPDGMDACHNDGNKKNNTISNLRWGTRKENIWDSIRNGRAARGERIGKSKLTDKTVVEARKMVADGVGVRETARRLGVSHMTISHAVRGNSWRHVA